MKTIVISEQANIPVWVHDLASFRRWVRTDDFPEHGRFAYLDGDLWVDLTMERVAQNLIKTEICRVLATITVDDEGGTFFSDRMLLTNLQANLSSEPDGMFVSPDRLENGDVVIEEGDNEIEITGSPDMTLEVISPTSVRKDTVVLARLYFEAGVREYWLVGRRGKAFLFDIFCRGPS